VTAELSVDRCDLAFASFLLPASLFVLAFTAQAAEGRPFTVIEEIGLAHFGDPYTSEAEALQFSPDGKYLAALTERGRIDLDRPEDTLRIYRTQDVRAVLRRPNNSDPPTPFWSLSRSTDKDGPIITNWRWLKDSSGIAFLERHEHGKNQLTLADLKSKAVLPLSPAGVDVRAFDIRDREHYVYAVADQGVLDSAAVEGNAAAIVGTGRPIYDLLYAPDQNPNIASWADRSELWAVVGGEPFRVKDRVNSKTLVLFTEGQIALALSPDGGSLVTTLAVEEIPAAWEKRYPPSFKANPYRLHAGHQDLATFNGSGLVGRYVRIDLLDGAVRALSDAPTGLWTGWVAGGRPAWSLDGKSIVLPNALVDSDNQTAARACVAVVNANSPTMSCVEAIEGPSETGAYSETFRFIEHVGFEAADGSRLRVSYGGDAQGSTEYRRSAAATWVVARRNASADPMASADLNVTVEQGLNRPPVLMATGTSTKESNVVGKVGSIARRKRLTACAVPC
jgi:hypothetical protein